MTELKTPARSHPGPRWHRIVDGVSWSLPVFAALAVAAAAITRDQAITVAAFVLGLATAICWGGLQPDYPGRLTWVVTVTDPHGAPLRLPRPHHSWHRLELNRLSVGASPLSNGPSAVVTAVAGGQTWPLYVTPAEHPGDGTPAAPGAAVDFEPGTQDVYLRLLVPGPWRVTLGEDAGFWKDIRVAWMLRQRWRYQVALGGGIIAGLAWLRMRIEP